MRYFFDASAAVKYYHAEGGSSVVSGIFAEPQRQVLISSPGFVEIQSAFAMKVRSGQLTPEGARSQRVRLLLDVAAGEIAVYRVSRDHFLDAERLIGRHAFSKRLRTLDAIQLAVALDLTRLDLADRFVVADQTLAEAAVIEGLAVSNPEIA